MAQVSSGWDYDFLNRLMKDDYYSTALNRDFLKEATTPEWDRNSGDPKPLDMDEFYNPPSRRAASGFADVPDPDVGDAPKRVGPTLVRPREKAGSTMAPPDYGTPEYAKRQRIPDDYDPYGGFGGWGGRRPRQKAGWKGVLGNVVGGAIAGATTPNVAGGGAVDIFRAMQAGGESRLKKDMLTYEMQRQRANDRRQWENDRMNRDLHQSQIEENRAQAEQRRQTADALKYKNQLERELTEAVQRGDAAKVKEVSERLALINNRGQPKKFDDSTPAERTKMRIEATKRILGLPPDTPDNDERLLKPLTQAQLAILEYDLLGKPGNISATPQPYGFGPGGAVVNRTTGEYKPPPGTSMAQRDANFYSAYKLVLGLDPNTPNTDPELQKEPNPYQLQRINQLLGSKEKVSTPARQAAVRRLVIDPVTGKAMWIEQAAPGAPVNLSDLGQVNAPKPVTPPRPAPGQLTQKDKDAVYAKNQARIVWQETIKQLASVNKIADPLAITPAENEAIYSQAAASIANDQFFGGDQEFMRNRGLISDELNKLAAARRQRTPPARAGDVDPLVALLREQAIENRLAKEQGRAPRQLQVGEKAGAQPQRRPVAATGPTGAPAVQPAPVVVPPPGPSGPTGPPAAYVPPPQTQAQQAELVKAQEQMAARVASQSQPPAVASETPNAKTAPGGGKTKQPRIFYEYKLRKFFDDNRVALAFRNMEDAKQYILKHGYVIK